MKCKYTELDLVPAIPLLQYAHGTAICLRSHRLAERTGLVLLHLSQRPQYGYFLSPAAS